MFATRGNAQPRKSIEQVAGGEVERVNPTSSEPGRARGRFFRELSYDELSPSARHFVMSDRPEQRLVGKAVAQAYARGLGDHALAIVPSGRQLVVRNLAGVVVLELDKERALNPGYWKVVTLDDRVKGNSPAFCRSGAGHPVWGRQWCLEKGFGLGGGNDFRWARTIDPRDVSFLQTGTGSLTRDALTSVLGDVVLDRLGLHALTLGYTDPLTGQWLGESTGPRVLFVTSGGLPVAEIMDTNRDNRADNLLVALRPW